MLERISIKLDPTEKKKKWYELISPNIRILIGAVVFVWALELIDLIPGIDLDGFGVKPRTAAGLIGIPLMPFLHGGIPHLVSNTLPFLLLGYIVITAEQKKFLFATAVIILLGGLGTWLIGGSNSNHIGASGLVYGYFGYVITRAIMEKKIIWIVAGVIVAILYGSLLFGVLPNQEQGISWQGHLCGLLAGAWFGWRRTKRVKELVENPEDDAEKIIKGIKDGIQQKHQGNKIIIKEETDKPTDSKGSFGTIAINPIISDEEEEEEEEQEETIDQELPTEDDKEKTNSTTEQADDQVAGGRVGNIKDRLKNLNAEAKETNKEESTQDPFDDFMNKEEVSVDQINQDLIEASIDIIDKSNPK